MLGIRDNVEDIASSFKKMAIMNPCRDKPQPKPEQAAPVEPKVLVVVMESMPHSGSNIEVICAMLELGGVFDNICPALLAMANESSQEDRYLYAAEFEGGKLQLKERLFGAYYCDDEKRHKFISPTD